MNRKAAIRLGIALVALLAAWLTISQWPPHEYRTSDEWIGAKKLELLTLSRDTRKLNRYTAACNSSGSWFREPVGLCRDGSVVIAVYHSAHDTRQDGTPTPLTGQDIALFYIPGRDLFRVTNTHFCDSLSLLGRLEQPADIDQFLRLIDTQFDVVG